MAQRSLFKRIVYSSSGLAVRLVGVSLFRLRCVGRDSLPAEGGVLVCSNHQSFFDVLLMGATCRRRLNFLARSSLFRFKPFRWLIELYDAIPIDLDKFSMSGLKTTLRCLKRGEMVLIFPEGTRTRDGEVGSLKPGFCSLARRGKGWLQPVAIDGAYQAWPRGQRFPSFAPIHIEFGTPLSPEEIKQLSDDELVAEVERRIRACHRAAREAINALAD